MKRNTGFSLIEVLVTLLLTAVGILGMVAMQSHAVQQTQDAVQRNNAVMLVNELVDIMRINASEIFEHTPPKVPLYMSPNSSSIFLKAKGSDFSVSGACTDPSAAITAQQQLDCWVAKVNNSLPLGADTLNSHSYVCLSSAKGECNSGSTLEIQLAWQVKKNTCLDADNRTPNDETCIYRTRVEL